MTTLTRISSAQKQAILKKLGSILKKHYRQPLPKHNRPVLETVLYAVCLENASVERADEAYAALETKFHDLNEIRVSSIAELEGAFAALDEPEWRALRVRSTLQYVFEKYFAFEFESLRKKTLEQAV
jgi:endonuclease-3